jgi:hypothetical protein
VLSLLTVWEKQAKKNNVAVAHKIIRFMVISLRVKTIDSLIGIACLCSKRAIQKYVKQCSQIMIKLHNSIRMPGY